MKPKHKIKAIVAVGNNNEIGKDNALLWHLPKDMLWFKQQTIGADVIMGRKSYEALPPKYRPLPNRTNIVITRNKNYTAAEGVKIVNSLEEAIEFTNKCDDTEKFIIGGEQIYKLALPITDEILLTEVDAAFPDADAFFPEIDKKKWEEIWEQKVEKDEKHKYSFRFVKLRKKK